MNPYVTELAIGACVVALLNYNQPRALLWIAVGAAEFAATYLYGLAAYDHPRGGAFFWLPHAFVTGVADMLIVIALLTYGVTLWERLLVVSFVLSIGVGVAHLWDKIDRTNHAIGLEIVNWLALLIIGGPAILRLADDLVGHLSGLDPGRGIHRVRLGIDQERAPLGHYLTAFRSLWQRP